MPSTVIALALDCTDAERLARFWSAVFGTREIKRWTDSDGTQYVEVPTGLGATLLLQPVPEPKDGKNRLHLDLAPATGDQQEEVRRLVDLGATVLEDEERHRWVVLADPEGNEFCVLPRR